MAFDVNKPADNEFISAGPGVLRENFRALKDDKIVNADKLRDLTPGNGNGNIAVANGTVCTNLNADKLQGKVPADFATAAHTHTAATPSSDGFMANTDKAKLDGIQAGAEVNQNAFSNVLVGGTTIQADSKTDTLEFTAGANIALTPDAINDRVTIAVTGKVPSAANADTATISGVCTGNAATATTAGSTPLLSALSNYTWNNSTSPTSAYYLGLQTSFVSNDSGFPNYGSVITAKTFVGGGGTLQLYTPYSPNYGGTHLQWRSGNYDVNNGDSWTGWSVLANINDIPSSLPANGGNADTVDGKHASDFARAGFGLGTVCSDVSNTNLNNLYNCGSYMGYNLANAPNGNTSWFYVQTWSYDNAHVVQMAHEMYVNNAGQQGRTFMRRNDSGEWQPWKQIATTDQLSSYDAAHSFATNGYQKLSNGRILQWGMVTATGGWDTISFPVAFPTACLNLQATLRAPSDTYSGVAASSEPTFKQVTVANFVCGVLGGNTWRIYWSAIGY